MHVGNDTDMGVVLHDLDPFTKYAVYVQAYSTALSKTSHTSSVVYFLTQPSGQCRSAFCLCRPSSDIICGRLPALRYTHT